MTLQETIELMQEIKNFYPRFEMGDMTIKAWHSRLENIRLKDARSSLHSYVENDEKNRVPALAIFTTKSRAEVWNYAVIDEQRNVLVWMPTEKKTIEKLVRWNQKKQVWEDEDGYEWGYPGE